MERSVTIRFHKLFTLFVIYSRVISCSSRYFVSVCVNVLLGILFYILFFYVMPMQVMQWLTLYLSDITKETVGFLNEHNVFVNKLTWTYYGHNNGLFNLFSERFTTTQVVDSSDSPLLQNKGSLNVSLSPKQNVIRHDEIKTTITFNNRRQNNQFKLLFPLIVLSQKFELVAI